MHQCQCCQSHYCKLGLPTNYNHMLRETWHVSLPFITTGPGTDSDGPGDIKYMNPPSPVFVDHSMLMFDWQCVASYMDPLLSCTPLKLAEPQSPRRLLCGTYRAAFTQRCSKKLNCFMDSAKQNLHNYCYKASLIHLGL